MPRVDFAVGCGPVECKEDRRQGAATRCTFRSRDEKHTPTKGTSAAGESSPGNRKKRGGSSSSCVVASATTTE
ncbi:MAG: hypothetical protein ACKPKO_02065, partial [Candidatus Fonsibacter sp.]